MLNFVVRSIPSPDWEGRITFQGWILIILSLLNRIKTKMIVIVNNIKF